MNLALLLATYNKNVKAKRLATLLEIIFAVWPFFVMRVKPRTQFHEYGNVSCWTPMTVEGRRQHRKKSASKGARDLPAFNPY
jgi:hypothetical protein